MNQVVNISKSSQQKKILKVIREDFKVENRKQFYSIEVTPLTELEVEKLTGLEHIPLFININWLRDDNLKSGITANSIAIKLAKKLHSITNVVSSITCYKMTDKLLDEFLSCENVHNFNVLRGGEWVVQVENI